MKKISLLLLISICISCLFACNDNKEIYDGESSVATFSDSVNSAESSNESKAESSNSTPSQNYMIKIENDDAFFQSAEYFYLMYTTFDFYKAYMTADFNMAKSLMVSDDLECLDQFPQGEAIYGNLDAVDDYFIDNLCYEYDDIQKIKTASLEIPLAKDNQLNYMLISFEYIDEKDESGNTFKVWKVTDFNVTTENSELEDEIDNNFFTKDYSHLQNEVFRFFKAYVLGDIEASKSMMDSEDNPSLSNIPQNKDDCIGSLKNVRNFAVEFSSYQYDEVNGIGKASIDVHFSSYDESIMYMTIDLTSKDIVNDEGKVIGKSWTVTFFDFDAQVGVVNNGCFFFIGNLSGIVQQCKCLVYNAAHC